MELPTSQETILGYNVGGKFEGNKMNQSAEGRQCLLFNNSRTNQFSQIQNFWKIEEPMTTSHFTADEIKFQEH